MRFMQLNNNGNVGIIQRRPDAPSYRNLNNSSWLTSNNSDSRHLYNNITRTDNTNYNSNCNIYQSSESDNTLESNTTIEGCKLNTSDVSLEPVCNIQYRLNARNNILNSPNNTQSDTLEGATETVFAPQDTLFGETDESANSTPVEEERAFDHSDTDDMSEKGISRVPRGIVNPNYPGFQHLAHTLQDYSSSIENFYHSENEMTDDDVDIDITDASYKPEPNLSETPLENTLINNINNNSDENEQTILSLPSDLLTQNKPIDSLNDLPDLLKTVSKNNNNNVDSTAFDLSYSDTDIENNFHTKDIIGDFNKEIEEEIKQLLNYNINIQDDLDELRKDIKDTFAKPIETTINNISDVVNDVIKKLVETQDYTEINEISSFGDNGIESTFEVDVNDVDKNNETNTKKVMSLSRPTFLLIENKTETITDAFLSDAKDEINISENEYDMELLSDNVEKTIKQLSTELRKIIPKLDEMKEQDRLWIASGKQEADGVTIDGNFNEIASTSKDHHEVSLSCVESSTPVVKNTTCEKEIDKVPHARRNDSRVHKESRKETSSSNRVRAQSKTSSVRKNESAREYELGSFDVYNIETALPELDIDAIESHLKAAKEAERRVSA